MLVAGAGVELLGGWLLGGGHACMPTSELHLQARL